MNVPYVKEYDRNGQVSNPIRDILMSQFPNRKERRQIKQKQRFYGNGKNTHLTVKEAFRFLRLKQFEIDKTGKPKVIEHYLPC